MGDSYGRDRRAAAAGRSYVTPALITLGLYFVLWLPGLIANLIYLAAAGADKRASGEVPQGRGCLFALFGWFVVLPLVALLIFLVTHQPAR